MADDSPTTAPQETTIQNSRGVVGRPNGKTERRLRLKRMSLDERKAHRKAWKAAQKKAAKK